MVSQTACKYLLEVHASQICQGFEAGVEKNVIIDFGSKVEKLCHK